RLAEKGVERPADRRRLLRDDLAVLRPAERRPGRGRHTLGTPTFVRPELALGLPPSLEPRHECEEPGAHLSVSCREVDLAIDGRHIDAGVHQRVHVPRRAQQSVDVHGDDQLEQSRFGVDKHPGPVGLGPAGLRGGDVVILVPVEDLPVACAAQLRDLSALCLDTPPFACCVHRDTYVSGDLLHLTNVTTPTCTTRIPSISQRMPPPSISSRTTGSRWACPAAHPTPRCAGGSPSAPPAPRIPAEPTSHEQPSTEC